MLTVATPQTRIDQYLAELRAHLGSLPREQATDIVEEIRSHIRDTAGVGGGQQRPCHSSPDDFELTFYQVLAAFQDVADGFNTLIQERRCHQFFRRLCQKYGGQSNGDGRHVVGRQLLVRHPCGVVQRPQGLKLGRFMAAPLPQVRGRERQSVRHP